MLRRDYPFIIDIVRIDKAREIVEAAELEYDVLRCKGDSHLVLAVLHDLRKFDQYLRRDDERCLRIIVGRIRFAECHAASVARDDGHFSFAYIEVNAVARRARIVLSSGEHRSRDDRAQFVLRHDVVAVSVQVREVRELLAGEGGYFKASASGGDCRFQILSDRDHKLARGERSDDLEYLLSIQYELAFGKNFRVDRGAHTLFEIVCAQAACAVLFAGALEEYSVNICGCISSRNNSGCGDKGAEKLVSVKYNFHFETFLSSGNFSSALSRRFSDRLFSSHDFGAIPFFFGKLPLYMYVYI